MGYRKRKQIGATWWRNTQSPNRLSKWFLHGSADRRAKEVRGIYKQRSISESALLTPLLLPGVLFIIALFMPPNEHSTVPNLQVATSFPYCSMIHPLNSCCRFHLKSTLNIELSLMYHPPSCCHINHDFPSIPIQKFGKHLDWDSQHNTNPDCCLSKNVSCCLYSQ